MIYMHSVFLFSALFCTLKFRFRGDQDQKVEGWVVGTMLLHSAGEHHCTLPSRFRSPEVPEFDGSEQTKSCPRAFCIRCSPQLHRPKDP